MIGDFQAVINKSWDLFGLDFTVYGYTFSFRQVFLWLIIGGMLLWAVGRFFDE